MKYVDTFLKTFFVLLLSLCLGLSCMGLATSLYENYIQYFPKQAQFFILMVFICGVISLAVAIFKYTTDKYIEDHADDYSFDYCDIEDEEPEEEE